MDVNGNSRTDAGDTVAYTFVVRNSGAVTLTDVTVDDPKTGPVGCPTPTLAPNASTTCTVSYTISQADVDTGTVDNTAAATATAPGGIAVGPVIDTTSTPTSTVAALTLDKQAGDPVDADGDGRVDAGDTIAYRFLLTNAGTTTLTDATVDDATTGRVDCPTTTLAPGASTTCAVSYTITQADVDAGTVDNTATARARTPGGETVDAPADSTRTQLAAVASLSLDKRAGVPVDENGNGRADAGDTLSYSFAVTNTGTATVAGVQVDDPTTGPVGCPVTTLAPGAATTCTVEYTVTQADVDAGGVDNTATATGTDPSGNPVVADADATSTPTSTAATLTLDKQAAGPVDVDGDGRVGAGDTISYTFLLTNTGSVTLADVTVQDPTAGPVGCPVERLTPGASTTCAVTYPLIQADVDAGTVENTATATATAPGGDRVEAAPDSTETPLAGRSGLELTKEADTPADVNGSGRVDAGDTIGYRFTVTNTGTVVVRAIAVVDPLVDPACPATTLQPGSSLACTATYTVTQADVDRGSLVNTAAATGRTPDGTAAGSPSDQVTTPLDQTAALTLDKQAGTPTDRNGNGRTDAGDVVGYTFLISNTGAVTLRDLAVVDPLLLAVTCPTTTLAPGASTTCTAAYTLTQTDVDAGAVNNVATAQATSPAGGTVESASDSATTRTDAVGSLTLDKQAAAPVDLDGDGRIEPGDTIAYTFTVTNTGSLAVDNLRIADATTGPVTCPTTTLLPGQTTTCRVTYRLTQADVDAGSVDNAASASAAVPSGSRVTSDVDTTSTAIAAAPGLRLDKRAAAPVDANRSGRIDAGDTIAYTFVVTNDGNQTVTGIVVTDRSLGRVTCPTTELAAGASTTCTADAVHVITQAEVDKGRVVNVASVSGVGAESVSTSDDDNAFTGVVAGAGLELVKRALPVQDANRNGVTDPGDTLRYRFEVTNTGTVSVSDIVVDDPMLTRAGVALNCPPRTLLPGGVFVCVSAPYTITEADARRGTLVNRATVNGASARGGSAGVSAAGIAVDLRLPPTSPTTPLPPPGGLARTGSPVAPWLPAVGLLLTLLGALLVLRRRPRTSRTSPNHEE